MLSGATSPIRSTRRCDGSSKPGDAGYLHSDPPRPDIRPDRASRRIRSAITLSELSAGPHVARDDGERGARQQHRQEAESDFDVLPFDGDCVRAFGSVAADLRASGREPTTGAGYASIRRTHRSQRTRACGAAIHMQPRRLRRSPAIETPVGHSPASPIGNTTGPSAVGDPSGRWRGSRHGRGFRVVGIISTNSALR